MGGLPWSDSLSAERIAEMWKERDILRVVRVLGRRAERGMERVRNDIVGCKSKFFGAL